MKAKPSNTKIIKPVVTITHVESALADLGTVRNMVERELGLKNDELITQISTELLSHINRQYAASEFEIKKHKITERRFWIQLINLVSPWIVATIAILH